MRLREVYVQELFGLFTYRIRLKERTTVLIGANGRGKTTILRMLAGLLSGSLSVFERTPFRAFELLFDNDMRIRVTRTEGAPSPRRGDAESRPQIIVEKIDAERSREEILAAGHDNLPPTLLNDIDDHVPGPYARFEGGWRDDYGEYYTLADLVARMPHLMEHAIVKFAMQRRSALKDGRTLESLLEGMQFNFIQTRRLDADASRRRIVQSPDYPLLHRERVESQSRVQFYSTDLVQRIKDAFALYAKTSQQLDSTFPMRLVDFTRQGDPPMSDAAILQRLDTLSRKRADLMRIGFLDREAALTDLSPEDVKNSRHALHIYVNDVHQKLSVLDDIAARAALFMDLVNVHFSYKKMRISRGDGFVFLAESRRGTSTELRLDDLSSGEQNELVLLYELLFCVPPRSLVLVDEPEISLHLEWQLRYLADLENILRTVDAQAVVATHSPSIIHERWDVAVSLEDMTEYGAE